VPLTDGEIRYGVLTLARRTSDGHFKVADLALVQELGEQMGLAIRVDRMFRRRSDTADALHASLQPRKRPEIPGVQIASKTGTAEHGTDPRHTPPHAWYIAFAPAQTPKVAVAVLVEDGADRLSATGGALAAPIGRAVIESALQGGP